MVRVDDSGDETKCWLNRDELDQLERAAGEKGWPREVAVQLMGRCGLRASEVTYPSDDDLRWFDKGEVWLFEVRSKNTKGASKTIRDAWMPEPVADDVRKYSRERGLAPHEPWVDVSTATVRRWVKEAAGRLADREGGDRWRAVSSHDLRRCWATYHLVELDLDVRIMMDIGWSDYGPIEPYLKEPTESRIGEGMRGDREGGLA